MDPLHLEMISEPPKGQAKLSVVGLGGAGGNAVRRMIESSLDGVDFIVANTDAQVLRDSPASKKLQIGSELTHGLGSGGNPEKGRMAAEESRDEIAQALDGADMVFIAAGMGGGTGTGASATVAELARQAGALTVGIVTRPFIFEGRPRMKVAEEGLKELRKHVDTLIVIPNQRLLSIASQETTYQEAMQLADAVLVNATRGITDIILRSGDINVDFADVRAVMENRGNALMGCGRASGADRAVHAATAAIASPLLNDISIDGAEALLVNITGGSGMTLHEVADATSVIVNAAGEQADVIFGTVVDPAMGDDISVTLIATGFGEREKRVLPMRDKAKAEGREAEAPPLRGDDDPERETTRIAAQGGGAPESGADTDARAPGRSRDGSTGSERTGRARDWLISRDRPTFMKRPID